MPGTIYPGGVVRRTRRGMPQKACQTCRRTSFVWFEPQTLVHHLRPVPGTPDEAYCQVCREKHIRSARRLHDRRNGRG